MSHLWEKPPTARLDHIDHCNLFIPFGYPGYEKMLEASRERKIDHFRSDPERRGIHVNIQEYFRLCGERKIRSYGQGQ